METKETTYKGFKMNGFAMLFLLIVLLAGFIAMFWAAPFIGAAAFLIAIFGIIFELVLLAGFISLEPNEARAMVFFGKYKGTFKETGFFWVHPFLNKKQLSLRARNLDVEPIKVNDKTGNPILIGLVLVWKLKDTYKAMFEIDSQTMASSQPGVVGQVGQSVASRMSAFENFVRIQSDAALRQVAGQYAYDESDHSNELTLRSGGEEINDQLEIKLNERLAMAGLEVVEARINYLAYAPEIAAVMLRRQQASAIITAREKIVEGAVSMVKMALDKLAEEEIVELDDEKKAAMVSNLLVVLCADEAAQPVVNTGTLHH
ncbi:SPFH domain-containing protein [Bacteroides sp. 519]|uniref:SPFH domain-containing protein n=1 Tax=Bacteroides sp. 519 TaxID=2302937 RepID=UPI0013D52127|nr:SPFH domain-containing protein [Bacteroides sp. 519]NDV59017.1 SPFH domain-containing protein [Bacteroides sp. 519]